MHHGMYIVWEFKSVSGETVRAIRRREPGDSLRQHHFQRIAWSGDSIADARAHLTN